MVAEFPVGIWIHVNSEAEGQIVVDYYSEFGYRRTKAHSAYPFMDYPYLCKYGNKGISGSSTVQRAQNTIEFDDWWCEVKSGDFEPAEQSLIDALLGR